MSSEPLILAVETATLAGSIAVVRGAKVIGSLKGDPQVSHSNTLLADLDALLAQTEVKLSDIHLFAVAAGPGSFTGLRIGLATVKALATTLDRSCAAIPTLHAVALAGGVSQATVALLPAGRGEVFAQSFAVAANRAVIAMDEPAHISPRKLVERYARLMDTLLWCGEGALAQRELIESAAGDRNWRIAPRIENLAQYVAELARLSLAANEVVAPDALRAIYVRPSDAELKV